MRRQDDLGPKQHRPLSIEQVTAQDGYEDATAQRRLMARVAGAA